MQKHTTNTATIFILFKDIRSSCVSVALKKNVFFLTKWKRREKRIIEFGKNAIIVGWSKSYYKPFTDCIVFAHYMTVDREKKIQYNPDGVYCQLSVNGKPLSQIHFLSIVVKTSQKKPIKLISLQANV